MGGSFLQQLGRPRPDPGGGAASAYSALVALALIKKVIRLEQTRSANRGARRKFWTQKLGSTRQLTREFIRLGQADVQAYAAMAQSLGAGDRGPRLQALVEVATQCPWHIMRHSIGALELAAAAGSHCRPHLLSDLLVAVELLGGALQGAHHIAQANIFLLEEGLRQEWARRLAETSHQGLEATLRVRSQLLARTHLSQQKK
jgi:formiminotetrahydrofolate cyclodeaminase